MNALPTSNKRPLIITLAVVLAFVALVFLLSGGKSFFAEHVNRLLGHAAPPPKMAEPAKPMLAEISPIKPGQTRNVIIVGQKLDEEHSLRKTAH